jgi:predicted DNA-binding transcriptional regulator
MRKGTRKKVTGLTDNQVLIYNMWVTRNGASQRRLARDLGIAHTSFRESLCWIRHKGYLDENFEVTAKGLDTYLYDKKQRKDIVNNLKFELWKKKNYKILENDGMN